MLIYSLFKILNMRNLILEKKVYEIFYKNLSIN